MKEYRSEAVMRRLLSIAALIAATLITLPAGAEDGAVDSAKAAAFDQRLFGGPVGDKATACFARRYDAAHLARHPEQKVARMRLLITSEKAPEDAGRDTTFNLGLNYRARQTLYLSMGSCGHARSEDGGGEARFGCGVDCDGGGFAVALAKDGQSVTVTIDYRLRIWRKGKADDSTTPDLEPDADDKSFRLERVELKQCDGLVEHDEVAALERN
jgi:hypothetical protein